MSNKKRILSVFVLLIFLSVGVLAQGFHRGNQNGSKMMERGRHHFMSPLRMYKMLKMHRDKLNITDDQLNKIKSLSFYLEEKKTKLKNENRLLKVKLQEELDNTNINYNNVRSILDKMSQNRTALFIEGLKVKKEIEKILTPEQLSKIRELKMQRMMRMRKNRMKMMKNKKQGGNR